jgi:hypothetical protein
MDPEENQDQEKQQSSTGGIGIGDLKNLMGKTPVPTGGAIAGSGGAAAGGATAGAAGGAAAAGAGSAAAGGTTAVAATPVGWIIAGVLIVVFIIVFLIVYLNGREEYSNQEVSIPQTTTLAEL